VIASQALISGAYSLTMQAVQMGYVPFINIRHTSHEEHGQIYISQINTLLALGSIALVVGFRTSGALANAYGIAVTLTMIATTLLLYFATCRLWKWSGLRAGALCALLLTVEGAFLAGNSAKVLQGGWVALAIGAVVSLQMTTWKKGRLSPAQERAANAFTQRPHCLDDRIRARVQIPCQGAWDRGILSGATQRRTSPAPAQSQTQPRPS
jgi:KUP system potassium uptake protein